MALAQPKLLPGHINPTDRKCFQRLVLHLRSPRELDSRKLPGYLISQEPIASSRLRSYQGTAKRVRQRERTKLLHEIRARIPTLGRIGLETEVTSASSLQKEVLPCPPSQSCCSLGGKALEFWNLGLNTTHPSIRPSIHPPTQPASHPSVHVCSIHKHVCFHAEADKQACFLSS